MKVNVMEHNNQIAIRWQISKSIKDTTHIFTSFHDFQDIIISNFVP